jgi:enamine deaminase RidA (YjgF/YER057c/UK114 family)
MVFVSGAVPMDAETGKLIDGDIQAHTVGFARSTVAVWAWQRC